MAISINDLRAASRRPNQRIVANSLFEAQSKRKQTAFLCHSHNDNDLVKGLQTLLAEDGWDVYIDWQDNTMPQTTNKETAYKIQNKIVETDWFIFLATPNSTNSKWCPWEIGFADAKKADGKILINPTSDQSGNWYGNEYLQLYRKIDTGSSSSKKSGYAVYEPGEKTGTWVKYL